MTQDMKAHCPKGSDRKERLRETLRENLKKRKAQARARNERPQAADNAEPKKA